MQMKKIALGLIIFLSYASFIVHAADNVVHSLNSDKICTPMISPRSVSQVLPGNIQWRDISNIISSDNKEAMLDTHSKNDIRDIDAKLVLSDGRLGSQNLSHGDSWGQTSEYVSYGGDLWKENLTPADINDPDFGFALQVGGGVSSYVLKSTDFGFAIPANASIAGITADVKRYEAMNQSEEGAVAHVDHVRMSVCYNLPQVKKNETNPILMITMGELNKFHVAPGELLVFPMTLARSNAEELPDITMQYQVRDHDVVILQTQGPTNSTQSILIPKNLRPGVYQVVGSFTYSGKAVTDILNFQFTVENKIAGFFVSQLIYIGGFVAGILLIIVIVIFLSKKKNVYDYADIQEDQRVYYEIINDMMTQMHDSIGDRAYKMADAIAGLSVDKTTGKILNITKDPSEVVSVLFIRYQNVFKKKLKIKARSGDSKLGDNATSVEENLDKYEKYFRKK